MNSKLSSLMVSDNPELCQYEAEIASIHKLPLDLAMDSDMTLDTLLIQEKSREKMDFQ